MDSFVKTLNIVNGLGMDIWALMVLEDRENGIFNKDSIYFVVPGVYLPLGNLKWGPAALCSPPLGL